MKFLSLTNAAKKLHTTVDKLIGMAAKGQIVLSVAIPPGITVWRIDSLQPDSKGQLEISKLPTFSHLDIGKQDCLDLLTNQVTPKHPIYSQGYLKNGQANNRYNSIEEIARRGKKPIQELLKEAYCNYRIIGLPGYNSTNANDNLVTLKENEQEHQDLDQQTQDAHNEEPACVMPIIPTGELVTLKLGRLEHISVSKESLLIALDCFNTLWEEYLPPDELIDHSHVSAFMLDMNAVARDMYGRAIKNRLVYPCRDEVIEALSNTESFKNAENLLPYKEKKALGKLTGVAADLIRPDEILGKGKKGISCQSYLSEKFKVLMATSRHFAEISDQEQSSDVQKKDIVDVLEKNNIPINMRSIAALLINPDAISKKGRTVGIIESHTRIRVPNDKRVKKK